MSSPFSSWERARSSSFLSQESREDSQTVIEACSPPQQAFHSPYSHDAKPLSSSLGSATYREPIRSFLPGSVRETLGLLSYSLRAPTSNPSTNWKCSGPAPVDSRQSAQSVREDTAELASYFLSDKKSGRSASFLSRARSHSLQPRHEPPVILSDDTEAVETGASKSSETIEEVSEPSSPETVIEDPIEGPSMLASMLRRSPPEQRYLPPPKADQVREEHVLDESEEECSSPARPGLGIRRSNGTATHDMTETAPLLTVLSNQSRRCYGIQNGRSHENVDLEGQKSQRSKSWAVRTAESFHRKKDQTVHLARVIRDPKCWDRRAIWQNVVVTPVASLPAVVVGLLLNILDALSYGKDIPDYVLSQKAHVLPGMILFPLGSPIFASLGPAGISIFYVSTIISQLTFSAGSIFRGGVGSELVSLHRRRLNLELLGSIAYD